MHAPTDNLALDLIQRAQLHPDRPLLIVPGRELSYGQLDELAWRAARYLHDHGVRRGDVVATYLRSDVTMAFVSCALMRLGATIARVPSSATDVQRQQELAAAGAKFAVCDAPGDFGGVATIPLREADLASVSPDRSVLDAKPMAPLFYLFGSGSTGTPRVLIVTHQNMRERCRLGEGETLYQQDARVLLLSSLQFAVPMIRLLVLAHNGGTLILTDNQPVDRLEFCRQTRATLLQGAAMHFGQILASLPAGAPALPHLRAVRVGSSTVSQALRETLRHRLAPRVSVSYATNECGVIAEMIDDGSVTIHPGSVGWPIAGVQVQVTDAAGRPLPPGERGLIRARTPCTIPGYLDDREATLARFREGWFHTGDIGSFTPDGQLIFHGRADDMMIFNGVNIYPAEIEACLRQLPEVADACAFPLRHPVHQDIPACAVALHPGARLQQQAVLEHARRTLGFKGPQLALVLDTIPRAGNGKLRRNELLQRVRAELQRQQEQAGLPPVSPR